MVNGTTTWGAHRKGAGSQLNIVSNQRKRETKCLYVCNGRGTREGIGRTHKSIDYTPIAVDVRDREARAEEGASLTVVVRQVDQIAQLVVVQCHLQSVILASRRPIPPSPLPLPADRFLGECPPPHRPRRRR